MRQFCMGVRGKAGQQLRLDDERSEVWAALAAEYGCAAHTLSSDARLSLELDECVAQLRLLCDAAVQLQEEAWRAIADHGLYVCWRIGDAVPILEQMDGTALFEEEASFQSGGVKFHALLSSNRFPGLHAALTEVNRLKDGLLREVEAVAGRG